MTSAASCIGTEPGRMMSPIAASRTASSFPRASCGSSEKLVTGCAKLARRSRNKRVPVVP